MEQVGTSEEVYRRPRRRFVAGFVGEANLLDSAPERCEVIQVRVEERVFQGATILLTLSFAAAAGLSEPTTFRLRALVRPSSRWAPPRSAQRCTPPSPLGT